jgi:hypothetical protein
MWRLLRIWHVEVLSTVAHRSDAVTFRRTSHCVAPERWQAFDRNELDTRVGMLLAASYAKRNHVSARSGDTSEMLLVAYDHEWVARETMPPVAAREADGVIVCNDAIHEHLRERACHGWLPEAVGVPRPGVDARPWRAGFAAFRIDETGETWHLVSHAESGEVFDSLLLCSPAESTFDAGRTSRTTRRVEAHDEHP